MRCWDTRVLPHLINAFCGLPGVDKLRRPVCEGLYGDVLEIGFGSGLNVPHYPPAVRSVTAVEPSDEGWRLSARRRAASPVEIRRGDLDGQHLDEPDGRYDCVLSTFTMCTIPDVQLALSEIRRVLRPDGELHFLEHGLAPDPGVQRWQHRLDPLQQRLVGGCHLARPIADLLTDAGFLPVEMERFYGLGPKALGYLYLGRATPTG